MNGGDNKPFQPRCPQYGPCQTPSNGRAGRKVPILRNTTAPVDIWGDSTVTQGPAENTFDNGFSQVASVTVISGGTGWAVGDTFTPHFADGSTSYYGGAVYGFSHGGYQPLLQVTKVDGAGAILTAKVLNPGCFVAAAIMDNTAVNASASGSGATIGITTTQAMRDFGANCNQTGHGYVSACRSWHGIPGFLDSDLSGYADHFCFGTNPDGTTFIAKQWRDFKAKPSTVKYTTAVVTMGFSDTESNKVGPNPNGSYTEAKTSVVASGGYTTSVDPLSGKVTQSGISSTQTSKTWYHEHGESPLIDYYQGYGYTMDADATEIDGVDVPCGGVTFTQSANYPGGIQQVTLSQLMPLGAATMAGYGINEISTGFFDLSVLTWSGFGLSPSTSGYTGHKVVSGSDGTTITYDTVITRTNTKFTWDYTMTETAIIGPGAQHFFGTITLSGENTSSDVAADIENNLLAPWVLNPRMIPLANDEWKGICIKVCRDEAGSPVNPFAYACDGCSTYADANNYDGSIIGLPYGGGIASCPADYYDQFYNNPGAALNVPGAGGWRLAAGSILSPYAMHWTTASEGQYLPFTRLCFYNSIGIGQIGGQIWKTKLFESSIRLSTYDHARPYGNDKDLQTVSAHDQDCNDDFVAVNRFTNVPPMAGRIAIKSITSDSVTGLTTVTTDPTPVQLDDHGTWPVDICDTTMTALCVATPTCSSTSVFTFPTPATPPDFTTAKWICLQGALPTDTAAPYVAHWYWADTRGKGQAYTAEIHGDNRIAGEATRGAGLTDCDNTTPLTGWPVLVSQDAGGGEKDTPTSLTRYGFRDCSFGSFCKGWIGCAPWLIVLSGKATDAPTHGIQLDFAVSPAIDERYGNTDYLTAYQAMRDPMFQYPFCPPAPTCIPLVEARHNMPTAGMSGTEAAPTGDNFISYPVNTCEFNFVNVIVPPVQADQPVSWVYFCPNGFYVQPC